jgi:hypothetical protein
VRAKQPRKVAVAGDPRPSNATEVADGLPPRKEPATEPAAAVETPERAGQRRRVRPRQDPEPVGTVVVADPPAVDPEPAVDVETPPDPEPCTRTSAAGCPPPRPPVVVTCPDCGLVAEPPVREPARVNADPAMAVGESRR